MTLDAPLRWRNENPEEEQVVEALILDDDDPRTSFTKVAMYHHPDGETISLGFHVAISLEEGATMPDVEDFIRRVRQFIDDEPVRRVDTS